MLDKVNYTEQTAALMPIKPKYVSKILSGEKMVEFRKTEFKKDVKKIIIYSSSPVKKVVAICDIKKINKKKPFTLWKEYRNIGGIEFADFSDYYNGSEYGIALELKNVKVLKEPIDLDQLVDVKSAPQSFMYVDAFTISEVESLPKITAVS